MRTLYGAIYAEVKEHLGLGGSGDGAAGRLPVELRSPAFMLPGVQRGVAYKHASHKVCVCAASVFVGCSESRQGRLPL